MPDSIVREVLTRATDESPLRDAAQMTGYGADDTELERILSGLRTNIKIVGVGGGGCNTIDRLPGGGGAAGGGAAPVSPGGPPGAGGWGGWRSAGGRPGGRGSSGGRTRSPASS